MKVPAFVFCLLATSAAGFVAPKPSNQVLKTSGDAEFRETFEPHQIDETVDASRRNMLATLATATLVIGSAASPEEAEAATEYSEQAGPLDSVLLSTTETASTLDWEAIFKKASKKALGGGKAGASAAVVQVFSLMWLRTAMNYQYRYGGNLGSSLSKLWEEGGIARLYQGLPFALVQGPMTRFGDTAANVGILALLDSLASTSALPLPLKTAAGSAAAGAWRIFLMPVDTSKTAMQVEGAEGLGLLWNRVIAEGPGPLYQGAVASAVATAAGHYPWFLTYNFLDGQLPAVTASDDLLLSLFRSAVLGLSASCVSDCVSNSIRVVKTTKQTAGLGASGGDDYAKDLSYPEIVSMIIEKDGIEGLLFRGLQTRLITNAIQGGLFSVLWRYFQQTGSL